ncbi:MAG: MFS transporter [SAR202 cluster bacterium]|nr:MFS transporter [SAR202 cluster bacterium]
MAEQNIASRTVNSVVNAHYAWYIVAMGTTLQLTTNFVSQAFAILLVVMRDNFGWSLTAIVLAYSIRNIIGALLSPWAGSMGDRYGAKKVMLVGAAFFMAGLMLLSTINEIWQLFLYYSLILGIAQAMFRVNIPTTVAAWFKIKLGVAVGIQQSAGGMGASVLAPGLAILLTQTSWETAFLLIGGVGGAFVFLLVAFFHGDPSDRGKQPYGADLSIANPVAAFSGTIAKIRSQVFMKHAKGTRAFWFLPLVHHLGCAGHAIVIVHGVNYAHEQGVSLEAATFIISIYSFTSIASRFMVPVLADRLGAKGVMAFFYFLQGAAVLMLFWTQEAWQFYLFAAVFGIGFGGEMSAFLVVNRQYFGMGPVRAVFGIQSMGAGLGMALGGLVGSVIYDTFGSYNWAWVVSIVASLGGVVGIFSMESTKRELISNWEESLPEEARTPAAAPAPAPAD